MKQLSFFCVLLLSVFLVSCDSFKKKFDGSEKVSADTLSFYLEQYSNSVDAYEASIAIIKDKNDYDFVKDDHTFLEEKINKSKAFIEDNEDELTEEMSAAKKETDSKYEAVDKTIKEILNK